MRNGCWALMYHAACGFASGCEAGPLSRTGFPGYADYLPRSDPRTRPPMLNSADLTILQYSLGADLLRFAPELIVSATIVLLLLARLVRGLDHVHLGSVALVGSVLALVALAGPLFQAWEAPYPSEAFNKLLDLDYLAEYIRGLLLVFAVLAVILTRLTGIPDAEDSADFYTLLLGGTLGMMVMASANHLLMVFIGLEMASLPSYALAGFLKGRKQGSEAALKYVLYGAASSGVALYGISLLTAAFGSGYLPEVARGYRQALELQTGFTPVLVAGTLFLLVGFGFKLGAVPFHFWLPDVFEGAAAEVGAFLSVASKAAAVGLTARFLLLLHDAMVWTDVTLLPRTVGMGLIIVAAITATVGNVVALSQTNLKRLLAYSTIAHAGYMLMALATMTRDGLSAVLFYLAAYLMMNLGAFATVAVIRNRTGSETVAACRGLLARSPVLTIALTAFLLSLLGIPPLAGFAGKFQVFAAVYDAGVEYSRLGQTTLGTAFYVLLAIGVLNTLVSAGYYLKVLKAAGLDEGDSEAPLGESWAVAAYLTVLAVALIVVGIWWGPLTNLATRAAMP